ncbi:MAG: protein DpdH [Rhodanobacter sp.]
MLDRYWPSPAHVDQCIRTEAETVDDAVLLAVHEPGPLRIRAANASAEEAATENDLLNELMRPADDGSAVIVAITGESGVGKSHMVRWLHAQLQLHPARERLVIVLVPKTASLRQVVERILEPLEGEQYEQLRAELSRVVETLKPDEAKQLLATSLAIELDRLHQQDMATLRSAGRSDDRSLRAHAEHTKGLSHLLRDPVVNDGWLYPVLERIVRGTLHGGSEANAGESRRFAPEDLAIPEVWDSTLATRAANIYLQKLQSDDGAALPLAAELLQEALDPALRTVFRFSEALGQRSIEEIVDDIRRHLLVQGRELVLLIEDFAALAGIQQPLLNLMIAESDHQGRRIRAPLRTALAVTDGFLPSRQTILTRAKREWIIPNSPGTEEEIFERLIELSGRYLNAARWGAEALTKQYAIRSGKSLYSWVRPFECELDADDNDRLKAFGISRQGYPLFPLSRESIVALTRRELRQGTKLILNPRAFINHVMRDVLIHRSEFLRGEFPPPGFKDAVMSTGAQIAVQMQPLSDAMRARLAPALVYWAGNPPDLASPPRVSKNVFDAFQLTWPFDATAPVAPTPESSAVPEPTTKAPKSPIGGGLALPTTPPVTQQDEAIEIWAKGQLNQQPALQVRKVVAQALNDRLDWNSLRMSPQAVTFGHIWLPFAPVGNPTAGPRFVVAPEIRPLPISARAGVLGLCRWAANERKWDYPRAEDDYAIAQILLDGLEEQAVKWFADLAQQRAQAALRTLHRQALLLRLTRKAEPSEPALTDYFRPLETPPFIPDMEDRSVEAQILQLAAGAGEALADVRGVLKDAVACFQGATGTTALAVDRVRLQTAWNAKSDDSQDPTLLSQSDKTRQIARDLGSGRLRTLVTRYTGVINKRLPAIKRIVGPVADVSLVAPIKELMAEAKRTGTMAEVEYNPTVVERALVFLGTDTFRSVLNHAYSFSIPDATRSPEFQLAACAEIELSALQKTCDALETLESLVTRIQRAADSRLNASGVGDLAEALSLLRDELVAAAEEGATS